MTKPYLFRWFETGIESVTTVPLTEEPVVGEIVWVAGKRYKMVAVIQDSDPPVVVIAVPEAGYKEPKNAHIKGKRDGDNLS